MRHLVLAFAALCWAWPAWAQFPQFPAGNSASSVTCTGPLSLSFPALLTSTYIVTMTANCPITLTGGAIGQNVAAILVLKQGGAGGFLPSFTQPILWLGGGVPAFNGMLGRTDLYLISTPDAGTTIFGTPQ